MTFKVKVEVHRFNSETGEWVDMRDGPGEWVDMRTGLGHVAVFESFDGAKEFIEMVAGIQGAADPRPRGERD